MKTGVRDERRRLETLRDSDLLDSPPERAFDRLTELVGRLLDVPVSLVSLVDDERQFFKSSRGLDEPWAARRETPLSHSFCKHVVGARAPFLVEDARLHPRVEHNPAIDDLGVTAYLGVPLYAPDGEAIGSLCAIDREARRWTERDVAVVEDLAEVFTTELRARELLREVAAGEARVRAVLDSMRESEVRLRSVLSHVPGCVIYQMEPTPGGGRRFLYLSDNIERIVGVRVDEVLQDASRLYRLISPEWAPRVAEAEREALSTRSRFEVEVPLSLPGGGTRWFRLTSAPRELPDGSTIWDGTMLDVDDRRRADEALRESEERYRLISSVTSDYAFSTKLDARGNAVEHWTTEAFRTITGYGYEDLDARGGWRALLHPDDLAADDRLLEALHANRPGDAEVRVITPDGRAVWVQVYAHPVWDEEADRLIGIYGAAKDITSRKEAETALRESEERYRVVAETASDAIITIDEQGTIEYVNPGAEAIFGYRRDEMLGRELAMLIPDHLPQILGPDPEACGRRQDRMPVPVLGRHETGRHLPLETSFGEFVKDGSRHFTGIVRDISERQDLMEQLEYLAYRDALTGLPNRSLLRDRLDQAIAQADRHGQLVALLFLDLDNFKVINDSLGHEMGDRVLKVVAERLRATVRAEDTVARLGGDEFVVVLGELAREEDAARVARTVLDRLAEPYRLDAQELRLTTSIGIALYPAENADVDELLKNADLAMYRAKEDKSTFRFFTPEMNARALERMTLEGALRRALNERRITVHYQPRLDLVSGRVIGTEALARWRHPDEGFNSPARFIPVAEEAGLIQQLGTEVLRQACRQTKVWQDGGHAGLRVSVNISAQQLRHHDLVGAVREVLDETGLEARWLELEVTESAAMDVDNIARSTPILNALRDLGIAIAVDDFGTGYSSLSYLKRLPIDSLKIDRSFLEDVGRVTIAERSGVAIVATVISLARNLGLRVVAEGVETPAQLDFLRAHRCEEAQGYLFSPPLPPGELEELLRADQVGKGVWEGSGVSLA